MFIAYDIVITKKKKKGKNGMNSRFTICFFNYCLVYSLMFFGFEEVHPFTLPKQQEGKALSHNLPPLVEYNFSIIHI
jgi:hypothetical protein